MNAQDVYASAHAEAMDLIEKIRQQIEDLPAPNDGTNWGHVGDVAHLVNQLHAIACPDQYY